MITGICFGYSKGCIRPEEFMAESGGGRVFQGRSREPKAAETYLGDCEILSVAYQGWFHSPGFNLTG
jgi:hypothetical protein